MNCYVIPEISNILGWKYEKKSPEIRDGKSNDDKL